MIVYLTFNDGPSGIYSSQVIDVVKFARSEFHKKVCLVAFISLRHFRKNRRKIRAELSDALVFPMVPGVVRWKLNRFLLGLVVFWLRPKSIIARSVLATQLALLFRTRCKIIYDGRGAIAAEWKEYFVIKNKVMLARIEQWEKQAVVSSDFCIAVSEKLVEFWRDYCGYVDSTYVVIPCTLNKIFEEVVVSDQSVLAARRKLGLRPEDVVLMYSGSTAGWQGFFHLRKFVESYLKVGPHVKMVFFSELNDDVRLLKDEFPEQIFQKNLKPTEMPSYLLAGDYGLLIRESSLTNQVASPVKFAEYLSCGLRPILSRGIGDYSDFVKKSGCGLLASDRFSLSQTPVQERLRCRELALRYFTKVANRAEYELIYS